MNKYEKWFMDACDDLDGVDPKDAWNAAIDAAMDAAINAAHPQDWIRVGMALERLKS